MAAPTTPQTLAGATFMVSAAPPATFDAAGYAAVTWILVGQVEDFGSHGLTRTVQKITPVDTAVVVKRLGSKDYGVMNLKIGNVSADAGQVILRAASESGLPISWKITYPLAGGITSELHNGTGPVASFVNVDSTVDAIQTVTCTIELDRKPFIVAAT